MTYEDPDSGNNSSEGYPPSRYMRARRPYLFSDSERTTEIALTQEVLSHHLDTLTNQKAEYVFEKFAVRLAEKFIAPNLRPQTGPTGGGDGKTDSETYPVSPEIAERWFSPDKLAASERWAFAFSAKREWRSKVRSDVREIVGTGRGYQRVYFITNQYVSARQSAEVQDALTKEYGVPVTIMDRTWILERVFDHGCLDIAQKCLGVGKQFEATVIGPRDHKRQTELDGLEKLIADNAAYEGRAPALADDALRTAKLARGLEKPRFEVDGRFERAVSIARQHELSTHRLAAIYEWAWTSYFWFDDAQKLSELYDQVEKLAIRSQDANDLERLSNLLPLLVGAVRDDMLTPEAAAIAVRSAALVQSLESAKGNTSRPNNALHAHALLLLIRISTIRAGCDAGTLDAIWTEFTSVIEQSRGLGTFPFESIANCLMQIGEFVPESETFDSLYESLTVALAERKKEGTAAKLNTERAHQKLNKGLHYEAIRLYGRAVGLLLKAEYEDELVHALRGCSFAYMSSGLYWAARTYALAAVANNFRRFKQSGSLDDIDPSLLSQWFECELQLGRVPYALWAYELGVIVRNARSRTQEQITFAENCRIAQGDRLAAMMIATDFGDLLRLRKFPAALDRLGLPQVSNTLLFLMGGEDALRAQAAIPDEETPAGIVKVFDLMAAARHSAELPKPDHMLNDTVLLRSRVLGCDIAAECENALTSLAIAEALLGALESLLATSLNFRVIPQLDSLAIRVQSKADAALTPHLEFAEENGSTIAVVTHRPSLSYVTREEAEGFPRWLQDAVLRLFLTFAVPADAELWGDTVLGSESGFSRSITFSNIPIMLGDLFGNAKRLSLDDRYEADDAEIEISRTTAWTPSLVEAEALHAPLKPAVGPPPEHLFSPERTRHSDYRIVSPIDARKWDAAKWRAVFYMCAPTTDMIPVLGLAFAERDPAVAIFRAWRERFGDRDTDNKLRIAIITGINISNPAAYAVIVGPNMDRVRSTARNNIVGFVSRVNVMTPKDSRNLDLFVSEFQRKGRYKLVPTYIPSLEAGPSEILGSGLEKADLVVRPAWTIGENDPDSCALNLDDPPVVPLGQANPPALKAMEQIARFRARRKNSEP
ncbi:hypothetical protein [Methylocystis rosea]|uniref:Tetratricopeptide repeat protein n=1 Tax=Methylocystis rosea TaxID=173366 RepID=A0A3G8M859_9HYPH|nr:hypothetical protein [Methylocystis rosea]AZG78179.1 hypothetical protein EHO51_16360 [Methylocystis rosea]